MKIFIMGVLLMCALVSGMAKAADTEYATRVIKDGTPITITIGDTVIPATLNNSKSAKALLARLPFRMNLHKYAHDYCGVMSEPLSYDEADVHNGWMNGDIDFARWRLFHHSLRRRG